MHEFKGRLYVGGNGIDSNFGAELFRISPDDSWDVVVGQVRDTPAGVKVPLSGLGPGFGWFLNAHMWRQEVFDGRLYVGTFDMSSILKDTPFLGPLFEPLMGFDLWATRDGVTFFPIVINGLEDKHNFGVRALLATPASGLFLGTANYWFGQEVWQGVPVGMAVASSGQRASHLTSGHLNGESTGTRSLLYWDGTGSLNTHLFRSELVEVDLAQQLGISEPVEVPGYFKEIGTTDKSYFVDTNTGPDRKFIYYVEVRDENGKVCDRSNWVTVPSATPAVTFRRAAQAISNMTIRNKFVSEPARRHVAWLFRSARRKALQGDLAELRNLRLRLESNRLQTGERILDPLAAEDLQILVSKLIGRVALFHAGILTLSDLQVSPAGANNSRTSD